MVPVSKDTECAGEAGKDSVCAGALVGIVPNKRIVMTFGWIKNGGGINNTILTVEFKPSKVGTEIVLTHGRLPDKPAADAHQGGWGGTRGYLENYLSNGQLRI